MSLIGRKMMEKLLSEPNYDCLYRIIMYRDYHERGKNGVEKFYIPLFLFFLCKFNLLFMEERIYLTFLSLTIDSC